MYLNGDFPRSTKKSYKVNSYARPSYTTLALQSRSVYWFSEQAFKSISNVQLWLVMSTHIQTEAEPCFKTRWLFTNKTVFIQSSELLHANETSECYWNMSIYLITLTQTATAKGWRMTTNAIKKYMSTFLSHLNDSNLFAYWSPRQYRAIQASTNLTLILRP